MYRDTSEQLEGNEAGLANHRQHCLRRGRYGLHPAYHRCGSGPLLAATDRAQQPGDSKRGEFIFISHASRECIARDAVDIGVIVRSDQKQVPPISSMLLIFRVCLLGYTRGFQKVSPLILFSSMVLYGHVLDSGLEGKSSIRRGQASRFHSATYHNSHASNLPYTHHLACVYEKHMTI